MLNARSRWYRLAATVALASLILQLGAMQCGCYEHNHWVQFATGVTHEPHAPHGTPTPAAGEQLVADEVAECSHAGPTSFVSNRKVTSAADVTSFHAPIASAGRPTLIYRRPTAGSEVGGMVASGRGVQAALQVFRL